MPQVVDDTPPAKILPDKVTQSLCYFVLCCFHMHNDSGQLFSGSKTSSTKSRSCKEEPPKEKGTPKQSSPSYGMGWDSHSSTFHEFRQAYVQQLEASRLKLAQLELEIEKARHQVIHSIHFVCIFSF